MLYDNIKTCPIEVYEKCITEGDLNYLTTRKRHKYNLDEVFKSLNNQLIDTFGVSSKYKKIFWIKHALYTYKLQYLATGEKRYLSMANGKEIELQNLTEDTGEKDLAKVFASNHRELSKWSGRDSRKLTMFEYYNDFNDSMNGKGN